jgi:hypothetical protein
LFAFKGKDKEIRQFDSDGLKVRYEIRDGKLHGKYTSYYSNGQKKAEGQFENNCRIGIWSVYDSTGELAMKRDYTAPFQFERKFPEIPDDPTVQLFSESPYLMTYNSKGYIDYFKVQERNVTWSKRIWRDLSVENNPILFGNDTLVKLLISAHFHDSLGVFDEKWSKTSLNKDHLQSKHVGIRVMEDTFFDNERMIMDTRILAIIPMMVMPGSSDTVEIGRFYMPQLREMFAKINVGPKGFPDNIKTLDDLFFFRYFSGEIIKVSNVHNKEIRDYKKGIEIKKEAEKEDLSLIEMEHDIWLLYSGK